MPPHRRLRRAHAHTHSFVTGDCGGRSSWPQLNSPHSSRVECEGRNSFRSKRRYRPRPPRYVHTPLQREFLRRTCRDRGPRRTAVTERPTTLWVHPERRQVAAPVRRSLDRARHLPCRLLQRRETRRRIPPVRSPRRSGSKVEACQLRRGPPAGKVTEEQRETDGATGSSLKDPLLPLPFHRKRGDPSTDRGARGSRE